jgi:hypothetical protein
VAGKLTRKLTGVYIPAQKLSRSDIISRFLTSTVSLKYVLVLNSPYFTGINTTSSSASHDHPPRYNSPHTTDSPTSTMVTPEPTNDLQPIKD